MKKLLILACCFTQVAVAQIKGNKQIVTQTFQLEEVHSVRINLYAKVTIDAANTNGLSITGDSNLIDLIGREITNGVLQLDQKKWISASEPLVIKIGIKELKKVVQGTHDVTTIIDLNQDVFALEAPIGTIKLSGKVNRLELQVKGATVDASGLMVTSANVKMTGRGKAKLQVTDTLTTQLDTKANLQLIGTPKIIEGNYNQDVSNIKPSKTTYVSIRIKNNSWNRKRLVVEGPNPSGTTFSYGFAMMPGFSKAERWTTGTQVYEQKRLGKRKLLLTISKEDAGKTLKLFK